MENCKNTARRARMFYKTAETTLCDICEGAECDESCKIQAAEQRSGGALDQPDIWAQSGGAKANLAAIGVLAVVALAISL